MGSMNPAGLFRLLRLLKPPAKELDEFGPTKAEQILGTSNPILQNEHTDEELVPTDLPSLQAYRDYLSKGAPKHEDYRPSTGRRILAGFQGFAAGASGRPNKVSEILNAPYDEAIEDYTNEGKGLAAGAQLDVNLNNQQRLENQNKRAIEARIAETKREIANEQKKLEIDQRNFNARETRERQEHIERMKAEQRSQELALARINASGSSSDKRKTNLQPEVDEKGKFTGRAWDPRSGDIVQLPDSSVGFRKKPLSDKMTFTINNGKVAISKAQEMLDTFDRLQKAGGGSTGHVGPVQGWLSEKAISTGAINNEDVNNLHMLAQELANTQLYAMSGAQINNREYERLRKTLPDTNKGEAKFRQDLERFLRYQQAALDGLLDENTSPDWTIDQLQSNNKNTNLGVRQTKSGGPYRRIQ